MQMSNVRQMWTCDVPKSQQMAKNLPQCKFEFREILFLPPRHDYASVVSFIRDDISTCVLIFLFACNVIVSVCFCLNQKLFFFSFSFVNVWYWFQLKEQILWLIFILVKIELWYQFHLAKNVHVPPTTWDKVLNNRNSIFYNSI